MIITFLLVSVIPITIAGFYSINLATESFERITLENTQYNLFSSAEKIYDFLNYNKSDVIFLSKSPAIRDYFIAKATHSQAEIDRWQNLLEEHFLIFCNSRGIYTKLTFIDENGQEIIRIECDGMDFTATSKEELINVSNQSYFIETMKLEKDQCFISSASASQSRTTSMTYATPVFDSFGTKKGIIAATMPAEFFLRPLKESFILETTPKTQSILFLISNTGGYLTHRVSEDLGSGKFVEIVTFVLSGDPKIVSGNSGTLTDNEEWIITYTPIFPDLKNTENFLVLVEVIPKNIVFSNIENFRKAFILLIASAIIISVVAAIMVAQTITRPLGELVKGTKRLAKKELSYQIKAPSDDELGFLANSFNEMAQELQCAYCALEDKVKERTKRLQLTNENLNTIVQELRNANEKIKEASQLKSQFISNISHELRTPLNAIIGFTDVLIDEKNITDEQKDYLETILRNSENLLQLINDMLDLSKIEANKVELVYHKVRVEDLLRRVYKLVTPLAKEKNIEMLIESDPLPEIDVDKTKLRQIFINLLTNAIKFNKEGGTVKTTMKIDGENIKIDVMDTGIGIEEKDFEIIFDEFHQIDGTTTRDFKGTGLGLAITKKYVEMHGGRIWVESKFGQWSKFIFTIPILHDEEGGRDA
ncbi:MAG: sensor histidine kinase [Candidatus Methanofastidiosia archaeon]